MKWIVYTTVEESSLLQCLATAAADAPCPAAWRRQHANRNEMEWCVGGTIGRSEDAWNFQLNVDARLDCTSIHATLPTLRYSLWCKWLGCYPTCYVTTVCVRLTSTSFVCNCGTFIPCCDSCSNLLCAQLFSSLNCVRHTSRIYLL